MSLSYRHPGKTPRIGALLESAEIVKSEQLEESAEIARTSNQPIGRVLLMLGYINDRNLKSGLLAQSLIAQGLMNAEYAVNILKLAAQKHVPIDDILTEMNWKTSSPTETSELGELLVESGFINRTFLIEAAGNAQNSDVLLGRFLLIRAALTSQMLGAALEAMSLINSQQVSRDDAVQALREVRANRTTFQDACKKLDIATGTNRKHVKLGEMLTDSGVISDSESMHALELALMEKRKFGQILAQSGLVPEALLEAALSLQQLASKEIIDPLEAGQILGLMKNEGLKFDEAKRVILSVDSNPDGNGKSVNLLITTGLITDADIQRVLQENARFGMPAWRALIASGVIERELYNAATDCLDLLEKQDLKQEQAIGLLQWCHRSRCTLQEALDELNLGAHYQARRARETEEIKIQREAAAAPTVPDKVAKKLGIGITSSEIFRLFQLAAVFGGSIYAVMHWVPQEFQVYLIWALMLALAIALLALGNASRIAKEKAADALLTRISSANVASSKLRKKND